MVITRFAPSPTGKLHIGGARTALFNFLYSKNQKGKFLLRIEDTDKERSKKEFQSQIVSSLKWLGIDFDNQEIYQSNNILKHIDVANELLKKKHAYKCYCLPEELEQERAKAKVKGVNYIYSGKCRNLTKEKETPYVIRLKVEKNKKITLYDGVQGNVEIDTNTIEDYIILRSDNTPTYNLSASVDDKLMNISHVIRGDDHKINAVKQIILFQFMGWKIPKYFHIPLIHTIDGKKLSKRENASTTDDYKKIGILPIAMRNYLLRLGWSYKDKEIFSNEESVKFFNLKNIGKSPSKLDFERIKSLNEYYIKNLNEKELFENFKEYTDEYKLKLEEKFLINISENINILKNKAKTLEDIYNNSVFVFSYDETLVSKSTILNEKNKIYLTDFFKELSEINNYCEKKISEISEKILKKNNIKFKDLGEPLRMILTGSTKAPSIKDIIKILGINETINRLKRFI
jgi:glutamyl-tRNA synthetase